MDEMEVPPQPTTVGDTPVVFDPSQMIGIIKRKALMKDLAAAYHAECLTYCRELLEIQNKCRELQSELRIPEESKEMMRLVKRPKKTR